MVLKKIGDKWYPVKKKGGTWKTGFKSQAAAKKAISQNKARLKKLGGGSKKRRKSKSGSRKKTTKKRSVKKLGKKKGKKHKKGIVSWLRGGVYVLAIAGDAISTLGHYGMNMNGLKHVAYHYTGRNDAGEFDTKFAVRTYAPLAAVATVDTVASKAGVYQRMSTVLS